MVHAQSVGNGAEQSGQLTVSVERTGRNASSWIDVMVYAAPLKARLEYGAFPPALRVSQQTLEPRAQGGGLDDVIFDHIPYGRVLVVAVRRDGATGVAVIEHAAPGGGRLFLHPGPTGSLDVTYPTFRGRDLRCFLSPGLGGAPFDELECGAASLSLPAVSRGMHELLLVDSDGRVHRYPLYVEIKSACRYELAAAGVVHELGCEEPGPGNDVIEPDGYQEQRDIGCDPVAGPEPSALSALRIEAEMLVGAQWNQPPVDHAAIGAALSADWRLADALLLGVRSAWLTGGDAGIDTDGDGEDDEDSDNPHLMLLSAGPTLRLGNNSYRHGVTALEFDVRGGAGLALNGVSASGLLLDSGVRLTRGPTHLGLRFAHGLGELSDFRALLFAAGFGGGGQMDRDFISNGCNDPPADASSKGFVHGLRGELLLASIVFADGGTLGPPGFALQFSVPVLSGLSPAIRGDVVYYPRASGDGVVQFGGSAGVKLRILSRPSHRLFVTSLMGYSVSLGTQPPLFGDGPFVDFGGVYELTDGHYEEGIYAGLRFRIGLREQNEALRALFVTLALDYDATD